MSVFLQIFFFFYWFFQGKEAYLEAYACDKLTFPIPAMQFSFKGKSFNQQKNQVPTPGLTLQAW